MAKVWDNCFCAFCKNERKIYTKKHFGFYEVLLVSVLSILLSLVFWQTIEARMMVIFTILLVLAELSIHLRWRIYISCPYCGFDPILYRRNSQKACEKVSKFMDNRKQNPTFYLSNKRFDKLAVKKAKPLSSTERLKLEKHTALLKQAQENGLDMQE